MYNVLDEFNGKFTYPTIASVARMKPDLVKEIEQQGHEVASHGYNHVRYPTISAEAREQDLTLSLQIFKKIGVKITGFRAPYDNYTDDMIALLDKRGLIWDGGYGYRPEYREGNSFFNVDIDGVTSSVTLIPLSVWSDDRMIDTLGMTPGQVSSKLKKEVEIESKRGGVIMFDLHPIRIGQKSFVGCLRDVLEYSNNLGGWSTTPTDAITYWKKHNGWKSDSTFCLLLTGDIDNWGFSDYLRRTLLKRYMK